MQKIGSGFRRFLMQILGRDKNARIPSKREYKRITEKAARQAIKGRTFGTRSRWNLTVLHHFGTFRPLRPFNH